MARPAEILFVDPAVPDVETILGNLRPEVQAIVLDRRWPAAGRWQPRLKGAKSSTRCTSLPTAHRAECASRGVIGQPRRWKLRLRISPRSARRLAQTATCGCGAAKRRRGETGDAFIEVLAKAVGADVSAATTRVGAAALGGTWKLAACASQPAAPLTEVGTASYAGVLAFQVTVTGTGNVLVTSSRHWFCCTTAAGISSWNFCSS